MTLKQRQIAALARPYFLVDEAVWTFSQPPPAQKPRKVLLLTNAIAVADNELKKAGGGYSKTHEMVIGRHFYYAIATHVGFVPDEKLGVRGRKIGLGYFMGQTLFLVVDAWCANMAFLRDGVRSVKITAMGIRE